LLLQSFIAVSVVSQPALTVNITAMPHLTMNWPNGLSGYWANGL